MENPGVIPIIKGKKIATEECERQFQEWVEAMDLRFDPSAWDDDDRSSFLQARDALIYAMESGHLVLNDESLLVYTPKLGDTNPITFYEPSGASFMAMDKKKQGHDVAKTYATLADFTKQSPGLFAKMKSRDIKVCNAIMMLFLG